MNYSKLSQIVDKALIKLKPVLDTAITGTYTVGNLNDQVNLINKCCPGFSTDEAAAIFEKLNASGVTPNEQLQFELSNVERPEFVYRHPVGSMFIYFYR